jgi:hypothetical protein
MGRTIGPWGRPQRLVGDNPGVTVGGNSRCSLSRWLPDRLEAGMPNSRRTPAEERAASVAAAVVLAALVIVLIVGVAWLVAFYFGAQGDEVGPDADEMAKDPVLHIEIDHASPGEIRADTGEEGGIAPGLTNSISTARRDWALNTADWEGALLDAVEDVDQHDVTWWSLSCSPFAVVFTGRTDVIVAGERLFAMVDVGLYELDSHEPFLRIGLSSDGIDRPGPGAPRLPEPTMGDECPTAVSEAFASLQR